ncbi:MAG: radical SAM protein, partial [Delftia acidovorans]|nr:radical SAM protein [Delftia acidovorans]
MTSTAASEIDEPAPPRERRQRVQAAETCLAVLKALATLGGRASLTAIAGAVEESPAKVHRYLASLMAEGLVTPYLDIPFQHAAPNVLRAMKRPANEAKVLERLKQWRAICPDITIRSSFVVGFPGETEADFQYLLDWLDEAQLDRVGAFRFEPVEGAQANALPDPVPEEVKEERYQRIM